MDSHLIFQILVIAIPVILAITFHEAAHGYVAWRLGDDTAYRLGRVTFNPVRHIDPVGTVILPAVMWLTTNFLFGWAKPVPVSFQNLRNPRRDMVWVALAGPATNIGLAILSAWLLRWVGLMPVAAQPWVQSGLEISILINVILAVFNMLPLPPLDGGRVAVGLLPLPLARPLAGMERYGIFLLLTVLVLLPLLGQQWGLNLSVLPWLLTGPVSTVIDGIDALVGLG